MTVGLGALMLATTIAFGHHVRRDQRESKLEPAAHLVESIPLTIGPDASRVAAHWFGRYLPRIPDGETGVRLGWIRWQRDVFAAHGIRQRPC